MSDIDLRHVHAVAKVAWETSRSDEGTISATGANIVADAILTSEDPAVHAALLAALVRADYLSRARELAEVAAELATASGCSPQDALKVMMQALTEVVSHAHD